MPLYIKIYLSVWLLIAVIGMLTVGNEPLQRVLKFTWSAMLLAVILVAAMAIIWDVKLT